MKKLLILLLIVVLSFSFALVACGKEDKSPADVSVSASQEDGQSSAQGEQSSAGQQTTSSAQGEQSSAGQQEGEGETEPLYPDGLPEKLTILFQGDSITDSSRSRDNLDDIANGYANMVARALKDAYGSDIEFTFINRANSGWNLIDNWNEGGVDHYEEQFYQYNADITTILIGYNDIMDYYAFGTTVSDEEFEACYRALLEGLKSRGTTPVCLAPFDINPDTDYRRTEFPAKRAIIKRLAAEFKVPFIDMKPYMMQAVEDGAYKMELFGDLVHPWAAGNRIISELIVDKIAHLIDKDYVTPEDLGKYRPLSTTADNAEDLTNQRTFFLNAGGKAEYDTANYFSTDEFASSQSIKLTNELERSYQINSYTRILFDLTNTSKRDLTKGKLTFNLKFDNFIPWLSVVAYGAYVTGSQYKSTETGYNIAESDKVSDDWYKITIDLESWAAKDTTGVLKNVAGIVITMSKGEDDAARERFGLDGTKLASFWIDNLVVDYSVDPNAGKEVLTEGKNLTLNFAEEKAYKTVSFDYQITGGEYFQLVLLDSGWDFGYGYFKFNASGTASAYNGVTCEANGDGSYHVTMDIDAITTVFTAKPDTLGVFFIRGAWSNASGYVWNVEASMEQQGGGSGGEELPKLTILFQGDSITDNNRNRSEYYDLGGGYAAMAARALKEAYGDKYDFTFINNGHSGWNLIEDWNAGGTDHYQEQFYQFNADITTILIGYNDIIDAYSSGGVSDEQFESCYRALLQGLKSRGTTAICLAPFDINPKIQYRVTEFEAKRTIIRNLAAEFEFPFIDMKPYMLQAVEDGAYKMELFGDLTHPWAAGCEIISELVVDKIAHLIDEDYTTPSDLGQYRPLSTTPDNEDDLTNIRTFFATSQGVGEYDKTVFYSSAAMVSTQSLKVTNVNPDPVQAGEDAEQANSYSRVLFDYTDLGRRDLTDSTIKFNVKLQNAEQWIMLQSYSALAAHRANCSVFYKIMLSDATQATALSGGWYEINVNVAAWAALDISSDAMKHSIALIITSSKGLNDAARTAAGINGKNPSIMWLDNLIFDGEFVPSDRYEISSGASSPALALSPEKAYTSVTFEYKVVNDGKFCIVALDGWANQYGYGYFHFGKNGMVNSYAGVTCEAKGDGWYSVTIVFAEVTQVFQQKPEVESFLFIRGSWTDANGYIQNMKFHE